MVVVVGPPAGTGCNGAIGRIGTGIGGPWLVPPGLFLATNPGQIALSVVVVTPLLGGIQAATVTRSLMFPSLVPSSWSVSPGFCPCSCCLVVVVLAPSPSKGSLLWLELEP